MKNGVEDLEDLNSEEREAFDIHKGELQEFTAGSSQQPLEPLFPSNNSPKEDVTFNSNEDVIQVDSEEADSLHSLHEDDSPSSPKEVVSLQLHLWLAMASFSACKSVEVGTSWPSITFSGVCTGFTLAVCPQIQAQDKLQEDKSPKISIYTIRSSRVFTPRHSIN